MQPRKRFKGQKPGFDLPRRLADARHRTHVPGVHALSLTRAYAWNSISPFCVWVGDLVGEDHLPRKATHPKHSDMNRCGCGSQAAAVLLCVVRDFDDIGIDPDFPSPCSPPSSARAHRPCLPSSATRTPVAARRASTTHAYGSRHCRQPTPDCARGPPFRTRQSTSSLRSTPRRALVTRSSLLAASQR